LPVDCTHRDLHSFPTRRSSDLANSPEVDWDARYDEYHDNQGLYRLCDDCAADEEKTDTAENDGRGDPSAVRAFKVRLPDAQNDRSEEHTSELQSQSNLVCRLLL